jgi:poly(3-hydroxybutyrate) depolymerase
MVWQAVGARQRFRALGSLGLIVVLFLALTPTALASSPTITVSGSGCNGAVHCLESAGVDATLSNGVATGSLSTWGLVPNTAYDWEHFEGSVTCMSVKGRTVTVGAVGRAFAQEGPESELPGLYEQVLSIEFGHFGEQYGPFVNPGEEITSRFRGFGQNDKGFEISAGTTPNCDTMGEFNEMWNSNLEFNEMWNSNQAYIDMSPEITSPVDGTVVTGHSVTLSGVGQAETLLAVYEVGQSRTGNVVEVGSNGTWATTFTSVPAGTHIYTASAVQGSTVPANTVQVNVEVPPPPPLSVFTTSNGLTAEWESLGVEFGYKIAVSNLPRDTPGRKTDYFEVQRGPDPQTFTPYGELLNFTPIGGQVYVGVGALEAPGTSPAVWSANEGLVKVSGTKPPPSDPPPSSLTTSANGQSVEWTGVGRAEWGYVAAVSNLPRGTAGRVTDYFEVPRGTDPQSFTPNAALLTFTPIENRVYVGVGTIAVEGTSPGSYTASEAVLTVVAKPPPAPVNTVLPSVSGSAEEGQTLTATTGSWSGSPSSYAYQWEDCDAFGEGCLSVAGATSSSYKLAASDVGHTMRVVVTATNAGGSTAASSTASATVPSPGVGNGTGGSHATCSPSPCTAGSLIGRSVTVDDGSGKLVARSYQIYRPTGLTNAPTNKAPLVLLFNGGGGAADWEALAVKERFVLALLTNLPAGNGSYYMPVIQPNYPSISVMHICGTSGTGPCDEGPAVAGLLSASVSSENIDTARVFATGASKGGAMTEEAMCDPRTSSSFAGFAPLSAIIESTGETSATPPNCPAIATHHNFYVQWAFGTTDNAWSGNLVTGWLQYLTGAYYWVFSQNQNLTLFINPALGCSNTPTTTHIGTGGAVTVDTYGGCSAGVTSQLVTVPSSYHSYSGLDGVDGYYPATDEWSFWTTGVSH